MNNNDQHISGAAPAPEGIVFGAGPRPGIIEPVADPRYSHLAPEDVAQPFVVLDESGIFSRVLLVRIWGSGGAAAPAALKIQKDVPTVPATRGFARSYTNLDAIGEFDREADARRKIAGEEAGIVPLAQVPPSKQFPITSLPVTYCKKTRQFFHPVCPECGDFLRDCRDEGLLARSGLPEYAATARRILYCPACATKSGVPPTVYSAGGLMPTKGTPVRIRMGSELYRDLGRLLISDAEPSGGKDQERAGLKQFVCRNCPHRKACYPARPDEARPIPAEKLLYPLSYYEFRALPRELYELPYDEFVQFLGGRPAEEVTAAVLRRIPRELFGERAVLLGESRPGFPAYLHEASRPLWAAEILWLKLGAFEQLCEGLCHVYERCERPHLDLQPKTVMATLGPPAPGQPLRWLFRAGILNPAAAVPVKIDDLLSVTDPAGFLSLPYFNRLYTSPLIRRQPYGHEEYANLTIRKVTPGTGQLEISGDLASDVLSVLRLAEHDRLKVTLSAPGNLLDGVGFWAEVAQAIPGGCRMIGRLEHAQPGIAEALERAVGQTFWDCRANICRRYDLRCDLYSLGLLLLCSLLVNDEQDETKVCLAVEDVTRRLELIARSHAGTAPAGLDQELRRLLAEQGEVFAPEAVLYRKVDRQSIAGNFPSHLWFASQKLGFAMTTEIAEFSVAGCGLVVEPKEAPAVLKSVIERLKDLNLWVEGRLFARQALRRELDLAGQV